MNDLREKMEDLAACYGDRPRGFIGIMHRVRAAFGPIFRGPRASRMLAAIGIDARRFWLLVDLFQELSERREMFSELGRNGVAVKTAAWIYFVFAGVGSLVAALAFHPAVSTYFAAFMAVTALFLMTILLPETSNSLVNPVEGLVLAHQPIDGATYTAAKLTHLLRIVLYLVPGMNLVAAFAGWALPEAGWLYPIYHLLAAFAVGLLAALLGCAIFGWLLRFVPPRRLRAVGQIAEMLPIFAILFFQYSFLLVAQLAKVRGWASGAWPYVSFALAVAAVAIVVFGLRALSGDYLIKVSSIATTGAARNARPPRSWLGKAVSRAFGGQESRAGFEYVSRTFFRDWQFRRQLVGALPMVVMMVVAFHRMPDIFATPGFSAAHILPHAFGLVLFFICNSLAFGSNYECGWFFLLAPSQAFGKFVHGVFAFLWIKIIAIPQLIIFTVLAWSWGIPHAALFAAYSLALSSAYLGVELRLIEGLPFSKQLDPKRGAVIMPILLVAGVVMAILVGVQYVFVFRSPVRVAIATVVFAALAPVLTRFSLQSFAVSIRYNLGLQSEESGSFYQEVL